MGANVLDHDSEGKGEMDPRMLQAMMMGGGPPVAQDPGVVPVMPQAPVAGPEQVDPMELLALLAASAPRRRRRPSAPPLVGRARYLPSPLAVERARNRRG